MSRKNKRCDRSYPPQVQVPDDRCKYQSSILNLPEQHVSSVLPVSVVVIVVGLASFVVILAVVSSFRGISNRVYVATFFSLDRFSSLDTFFSVTTSTLVVSA